MNRRCVDCGQSMTPAHVKTAGTVEHRGHGLCARCYARQQRHSDYADPIAVQRLIDGDPPATVTRLEMCTAIDVLDARGFSASEIAERVGLTKRSIERRRAQRKKEVAA